jgi:hypothetical protein
MICSKNTPIFIKNSVKIASKNHTHKFPNSRNMEVNVDG